MARRSKLSMVLDGAFCLARLFLEVVVAAAVGHLSSAFLTRREVLATAVMRWLMPCTDSRAELFDRSLAPAYIGVGFAFSSYRGASPAVSSEASCNLHF